MSTFDPYRKQSPVGFWTIAGAVCLGILAAHTIELIAATAMARASLQWAAYELEKGAKAAQAAQVSEPPTPNASDSRPWQQTRRIGKQQRRQSNGANWPKPRRKPLGPGTTSVIRLATRTPTQTHSPDVPTSTCGQKRSLKRPTSRSHPPCPRFARGLAGSCSTWSDCDDWNGLRCG